MCQCSMKFASCSIVYECSYILGVPPLTGRTVESGGSDKYNIDNSEWLMCIAKDGTCACTSNSLMHNYVCLHC